MKETAKTVIVNIVSVMKRKVIHQGNKRRWNKQSLKYHNHIMREPLSIDKKSERYKTQFTKAKDLDEVHFEKEKVNSTPQNVRKRNTSEIIAKNMNKVMILCMIP